jgi:hypothetical protein
MLVSDRVPACYDLAFSERFSGWPTAFVLAGARAIVKHTVHTFLTAKKFDTFQATRREACVILTKVISRIAVFGRLGFLKPSLRITTQLFLSPP